MSIIVLVALLSTIIICMGQTFPIIESDGAFCKKPPTQCLMSQYQRDTWIAGCYRGLCPGKNVSCVSLRQTSVYFCATYDDEMCPPGVYKEYTINKAANTVTLVTLECPDGYYSDMFQNCTKGCYKSHLPLPDPNIYTLVAEGNKTSPAILGCNTENRYCPENETTFKLTERIYYVDYCKRVPVGMDCARKEKEKPPDDQRSTAEITRKEHQNPPGVQTTKKLVNFGVAPQRTQSVPLEEDTKDISISPAPEKDGSGTVIAIVAVICFAVVTCFAIVGMCLKWRYCVSHEKERTHLAAYHTVAQGYEGNQTNLEINLHVNSTEPTEGLPESNESQLGSGEEGHPDTQRMQTLKETDSLGPLGNTERKEMY